MKLRIIVMLIGLIIGILGFIFNEVSKYNKSIIEKDIIKKDIENIKKREFETEISKIKEIYQNNIENKEIKKDNKFFTFNLYDFSKEYEKMYKVITNNKYVKDKIGYKSFINSPINKKLIYLRENMIVFEVINKEGKIIKKLNYIPINIDCKKLKIDFCPKKISNEYNEIYLSNKNYLKIIEKKDILTKNDYSELMKNGKETFYTIMEKKNVMK